MKKKLLWILLLGACLALFGCGNDRLESTPAPVATTMAAPEQTEKVTDERKEAWEKASQWLKGYYEKEVTTDQYSEDKVEKESDGYIITMKVYLEAAGKVEVKTITLITDKNYVVTSTRNLEKTTEEVMAERDKEEKEKKEKAAKEKAAKEKAAKEKAAKEKASKKQSQKTVVNNNYYISTPSQCYQYYWDYEYVIPDSNSRYLSYNELYGYSIEQLRLARNEIYARHGRLFANKQLQNYFSNKSWYYGCISPNNFRTSVFNRYEKANVDMIVRVERDRK